MAVTKGKKLTKVEAVRRVLADLGHDTRPITIRDEVKKRFNIVMTAEHASNAKGEVLRQLGKQAAQPAVARPAAAKPEPAPMPAVAKPEPTAKTAARKTTAPKTTAPKAATPVLAKATAGEQGISLADIAAVKGLVGRVGADQLRGLIKLIAE
jgi:pyruvate/2-oxoglutarate dehydrogenase complex dihydrolipoamide acyltransferase (E2) component